MKDFIHGIYKITGKILCAFHLIFSEIKKKISPVKETSILFVAHPDDDVLFFNRVMKTEKPYVVLLTTGFSIIRIREFRKAMKHYGLRCNYHMLETRDEREDKLAKIIKKEMKSGSFEKCFTHSPLGEYGHVMHQRIGRVVPENVDCRVFTTVSADEIDCAENELSEEEKKEKIGIFNDIYSSQDFVLELYSQWVTHEKIREAQK